MRIITGEYKGRILSMPKGKNVRPTTEKVKEAIFSTIMYYVEDSVVCDLFSGTGNLGLEALSRGANLCYFCDNSRESIELLKSNISMCRADDKAKVFFGDFKTALNKLSLEGNKVDIFLLDPPYKLGLYDDAIKLIRNLNLLNDGGIILVEHAKEDLFPEEFYGFKKVKDKFFGNISFTIYS